MPLLSIRFLTILNVVLLLVLMSLQVFVFNEATIPNLVIAGAAVIVAIGLAGQIGSRVTRGMGQAQKFATALASGDLTARIEEVGNDEFSEINQSLNKAAERL